MAKNAISKNRWQPYIVALAVAMICALGVSLAAVLLRPHYQANLEAARIGKLGSIITALNASGLSINPDNLLAVAIDLDTGVAAPAIHPSKYDARKAAQDPGKSTAIPTAEDYAQIKRRENHAVVYVARDEQNTDVAVILPIWGVGYQSAIYGYLALAADVREILALKIYEHGETPGLGSRIQEKDWEDQWPGKQAFDDENQISIHVGGSNSTDRIDAISGATRTSMGVDGMLRFWLGDSGFALFLDNFRQQRAGL